MIAASGAMAALVAIPAVMLAIIAMVGFLADARRVYGAGFVEAVEAIGIAASDGFLGWLRRKHVEGIG